MAEVMVNGMVIGAQLAGMKVGRNPTLIPQAHSLREVDLDAPISPTRFQRLKMNLDTGAAVNACPLNFGPDCAGDRRFHTTASDECILDGGALEIPRLQRKWLQSISARKTPGCSLSSMQCGRVCM